MGAVIITQTIATLISVYGVFISPMGWELAGFIWGYAIAGFLIFLKVQMYKIADRRRGF